jgi:DNA invertase Pin-like site-specific DNA recombinase
MPSISAAVYARVSSEQQARHQTIASQLAALRERLLRDGAPGSGGRPKADTAAKLPWRIIVIKLIDRRQNAMALSAGAVVKSRYYNCVIFKKNPKIISNY